MSVYDSALYQGKMWFAYELKDGSGNYKEEYRLLMRMESQKHSFVCPECQEKMMLCAGNIMEPYFRHYSDGECARKAIPGSGMTLAARRMIYHILRSSFPEAEIETCVKLNYEGIKHADISADFLVRLSGERLLAATYLSCERKLAEWEETHLICQSVGIEDVWFLNARYFWSDRRTTFEYLVSKYFPLRLYIEYDTGSVQIREDKVLFQIPVLEFILHEDGSAKCRDALKQIEEMQEEQMQETVYRKADSEEVGSCIQLCLFDDWQSR